MQLRDEQAHLADLTSEFENSTKILKFSEKELEDVQIEIEKSNFRNGEIEKEQKKLQERTEELKQEKDSAARATRRAKELVVEGEEAMENKRTEISEAKSQEIIEEIQRKLNSESKIIFEDIEREEKYKNEFIHEIRELMRQTEFVRTEVDNLKNDREFHEREKKKRICKNYKFYLRNLCNYKMKII